MDNSFQWASVGKASKGIAHNLFTWQWTKFFLHWLIISAGTVAECVFLIASLWISVNASVHTFVLLFIDETTTEHITELATAAYVALPELILALACVVTIGHVRMWLYDRNNYAALAWVVLFGFPTLVFLVLSLVTLGSSVLSVNFRLPETLVVVRALAGYVFAFAGLLYTQLGLPQEKDRLQKKDTFIEKLRQDNIISLETLRQEKDSFTEQLRQDKDVIISSLRQELERANHQTIELNERLQERQRHEALLVKALNKSSEDALQAYSQECKNWLASGIKTANLEELSMKTGISKRRIVAAIKAGKIQTSSRNHELVLVSSLASWLETQSPIAGKDEQDTGSLMQITGDMIDVATSHIAGTNGHYVNN